MSLVEFTVAGALVETHEGILIVRNRRRSGATDWSTPGGVIDTTDASVVAGLTREVEEETGIVVARWEGPLYEVRATAPELGWSMRCEVHRALAFDGELRVDDPDGIVIEAMYAQPERCLAFLEPSALWVREPLGEWIAERWGPDRARFYAYDIFGNRRNELHAVRAT
jgi:8-oxo-dGTP diphosphatase